MELKVLAADKISSYRRYVFLHEKLFDCVSLKECFDTAKNLIKSFTQNRQIFSEFAYYKEHGRILGKHPIFSERKKIADLEKKSTVALMKQRLLREKSIWRLKAEIKKNDKPHLIESRQQLIERHQREISEIDLLLKDRK